MKPYFDSGALVKVYVKERGSNRVIDLIGRWTQIELNPLQELEVCNGLTAQAGRGFLSRNGLENALSNFAFDIVESRLLRTEPDWSFILRESIRASERHTEEFLCRSLDIMHVLCARATDCNIFVTGDQRQARLARAMDLDVLDIFAQPA